MSDDPKTNALTPVASIAGGAIMHAPVSQFTPGGAAQAWLLLDLLRDMIDARQTEFRATLLAEAEAGNKEKSGSLRVTVDGTQITKERRESKKLDLERVQELLLSKGIPPEAGCDVVQTLVPNHSKLAHLVSIGKITQEELDKIQGKVTWALKVKASKEFADLLAAMAATQANKKLK